MLLLDQRLDSFAFVDVLDDRFVSFVLVVEDFGVLEVLDQARKTLQSCVGQHANLNFTNGTLSLLNFIHLLLWNFL